MPPKRRYYLTNSNRLSEYYGKLAACTVGIHLTPSSFCSVCGKINRSVPYVIHDGEGGVVCDCCALALRLPVFRLKKSSDAALTIFEDHYDISSEYSFYWRVGIRKRDRLRIDFHTRALIETLCDKCAAFGLKQAYLVCLQDSPLYMELASSFHDDELVSEAFRRAEPEFSRLIETGQNDRCRIEYFYVVDAMDYPPGLDPVKPDELVPDLPSWKWPPSSD